MIEFSQYKSVGYVTLNRPEKLNAMSEEMILELAKVASELANNSKIRVAVLKGSGKSFCAGADLEWMRKQFTSSNLERRKQALRLAKMLQKWYEMPKPVIGEIHGNVFGGGVGLTSICDTVIAEENTMFSLSETRLGLIPATISPYVIAKIGASHSAPLFMSGRRFDVRVALDIGLVQQVSIQPTLEETIQSEVETYLQSAPGAIAAAKMLIRQGHSKIEDSLIEWTVDQLVDRWSQPEAIKGVKAFFERRKPDWNKSG